MSRLPESSGIFLKIDLHEWKTPQKIQLVLIIKAYYNQFEGFTVSKTRVFSNDRRYWIPEFYSP